MDKRVDGVEESLGSLGTAVDDKLETLGTAVGAVDDKLETLGTAVDDKLETLGTAVDDKMNALRDEMRRADAREALRTLGLHLSHIMMYDKAQREKFARAVYPTCIVPLSTFIENTDIVDLSLIILDTLTTDVDEDVMIAVARQCIKELVNAAKVHLETNPAIVGQTLDLLIKLAVTDEVKGLIVNGLDRGAVLSVKAGAKHEVLRGKCLQLLDICTYKRAFEDGNMVRVIVNTCVTLERTPSSAGHVRCDSGDARSIRAPILVVEYRLGRVGVGAAAPHC